MKLLLDTHAFIWWDDEPTKLSPAAIAACRDTTNTLHLSLGSVWPIFSMRPLLDGFQVKKLPGNGTLEVL